MTTHDAYLSATVAAKDAAIAAKDAAIASLRTWLDASSRRESDLLQRAADNLRVANEEAVQMCREKNRRIADLEEQCCRLLHSPVQNELAAIHAAHRAAVVRWSDAEAVIKSYQHEVSCHRKAAELHVSEITTLKQRNEQQAESIRAYRTENEAFKNSDQTAEIRRLKTRLNQLIATVHHASSVFHAWVPENL